MKWAFVDYENVGNLDRVNLAAYEKVIVLAGAHQSQLNFGTSTTNKLVDISYLRVERVSKNNVDLHLAYYLGVYQQEAPENVCFDVVSNDKGYKALIEHINKAGRSCKRVGWCHEVKNIPRPSRVKGEKKTTAHLIHNIINSSSQYRPKTLESLGSYIGSFMKVKGNTSIDVDMYIKELVKEGVIQIAGESVKYTL